MLLESKRTVGWRGFPWALSKSQTADTKEGQVAAGASRRDFTQPGEAQRVLFVHVLILAM